MATTGQQESDRELWFGWKRAHEIVRGKVAEEVAAQTGLSDADTGVLIRIDEAGRATRQSVLASGLGWDRTRLSHHLTRMEARGLVARTKVVGGVEVALTADGRRAIDAARPLHAAAVRRFLVEAAGPDVDALRRVLGRVLADEGA